MRLRQRRVAVRGGFTLMELLVVVAILVVLAGAAVPIYMKYLEDSRWDRAWHDTLTISGIVEAYNLRHGHYPESLQTLAVVDESGYASLEARFLIDPWNKPYQYSPQGTHSTTGKADVWTTSPK